MYMTVSVCQVIKYNPFHLKNLWSLLQEACFKFKWSSDLLEVYIHIYLFVWLNEQRNVMRKQRNWEKQLAAKKSKRKEEKQRRKLNREQQPGRISISWLDVWLRCWLYLSRIFVLQKQIT